MNLDEIYATYQDLKLGGKNGTSKNFVPGDGPYPTKLMIIGEAPGAEEDRTGKPFQGPSGELLNRFLGLAHVQREDVFVTNAFKYRPPQNRNPFPSELIASLPCLSAEIKCVDPKVIILAGRIAVSSVFPGQTPRSLRGKGIEKGGRIFVCTYHPGAVLRKKRSTFYALVSGDFKLAAELSKS